MAVLDYVQSTKKDAGTVTSSTLAYGSNVTAGNTLLVRIRRGGTTGTISASDNLNGSWTAVDKELDVTNGGRASSQRFSNTAGGACTLTVTFSVSQSMRWAQMEYQGNLALDSANAAEGNDAAPTSASITTTHTCAIIGEMTGANNLSNNTATAGTGYTMRENLVSATNSVVVAVADRGGAQTAGTYTSTFTTVSADNWGCTVLGYYDASAVGFDVPLLQPPYQATVWRM